jgi:fructose/tagatose bisphosphate aldolase
MASKKSAKIAAPAPVEEPVKEAPPPVALHQDTHTQVPPVVENLLAPEFFATEAQSISLVQGMISIAFSSSRYDYSENPSVLKKVVVSRVVMSPIGAQSLAVRLFAFLDQKGLGPAPKDPKQRM